MYVEKENKFSGLCDLTFVQSPGIHNAYFLFRFVYIFVPFQLPHGDESL